MFNVPSNGEATDLSLAPKLTRAEAWSMNTIPNATIMVAIRFPWKGRKKNLSTSMPMKPTKIMVRIIARM